MAAEGAEAPPVPVPLLRAKHSSCSWDAAGWLLNTSQQETQSQHTS